MYVCMYIYMCVCVYYIERFIKKRKKVAVPSHATASMTRPDNLLAALKRVK